MLDLAILGLLSEQDLHGYELKKRISALHGPSPSVSFGSLYPALNRLERADYVEVQQITKAETPAAPMTGSLSAEARVFRVGRRRPATSRRSRKMYSITTAGLERLALLLNDEVSDDRVFSLKLAFLSQLRAEHRTDQFRRRRRFLEDRMDEAQRSFRAESDSDRFRKALLQHHVDAATFELGWLDELIQSETTDLSSSREADTVSVSPDSRGTP